MQNVTYWLLSVFLTQNHSLWRTSHVRVSSRAWVGLMSSVRLRLRDGRARKVRGGAGGPAVGQRAQVSFVVECVCSLYVSIEYHSYNLT